MKKTKQFFKLMKYEFKRVLRNKFVISMLLFFSIVMLLLLSLVDVKNSKFPIAIFLDGQNVDEVQVIDLINESVKTKELIYVDSEEEGLDKIRRGEVCFFISLNSENSPVTATFYYDGASAVGRTIKDSLSEAKSEYTYNITNEFLNSHGISINEAYFNTVSFNSSTKTKVTARQMMFSTEAASCVSIILMFGLAYSISRDNETKVSKNLAYTPIGTQRFLWAKIIPYFVLGMLEIGAIYILGGVFFGINYQINPILIFLLSSLFVLSSIMMGLLFSTAKSQIATIFLDVGAIIMPIFVVSLVYLQNLILPFRLFLYCMPISLFVGFLNGMMFNGVVIWWNIIIFILQIIIYYIATVLIMQRRIKNCKF